MYKIPDLPCRKCGGNTSINYLPSSGMDIKPTGMFRNCHRCGFSENIKDLEDENKQLAEARDEIKNLK